MNDKLLEVTGEAPRGGFGGWIAGRANRKSYWAWAVPLLVLMIVLAAFEIPGAELIGGLPLLLVWIRRLHDLGRTGWWAPVINIALGLAGFAVGLALGALAGELAGALLSLGALAILGSIPGQPHANEFGPPPGRPDFAATFGEDLKLEARPEP